MKLEWFRRHKTFVYWVLLPIVGGGMAFFGLSGALGTAGNTVGTGRSVTIDLNGHTRYYSPSDVFKMRMLLTRFGFSNGSSVSSGEAGSYEVKYRFALDSGFEAGDQEMEYVLRDMAKSQIARRERTKDFTVNEEIFKKLLENMNLTAAQFESLSHQYDVMQKCENTLIMPAIDDGQLFMAYCRKKESVRLRYKEIKSEDYLSQAAAPTEDKVKAFYNEATGDKKTLEGLKDILVNEPKLSAELLYFDTGKFLATLKPTPEELQKYYERTKLVYYRVPPKAGETPPAPGNVTYKPFDEVKADVEAKWLAEQKNSRPRDKFTELRSELEKTVAEHDKAEAAKPEKDRTPFDLKTWAASKGLGYWVTPEQTAEQYQKGKKEVNAPDAAWVAPLFFFARDFPGQEADPARDEMRKKYFETYSTPIPVDMNAPEKGMIIYHKKTYVPEQTKSFEQAKADIAKHLQIIEACKLAEKEATRLHDEWVKGDKLPPPDSLQEVSGDSTSRNGLVEMFFQSPKAVGQILPVASEDAPDDPDGKINTNVHYQVGFAVARKLPDMKQFEMDTAFDRKAAKQEVARADIMSASNAYEYFVLRACSVYPDKMEDPPLFDNYRRGHSGDEN